MNNPKYPTLIHADKFKIITFDRITKTYAILKWLDEPTKEISYQVWKKMDD